MASFDARLRVPGQTRIPVNVVIDISGERLRLSQGEVSLGNWPIANIVVDDRSDGFHVDFDGEEVVLTVSERSRFAGELARARKPKANGGEALANGTQQPRSTFFSRLSEVDPEDLVADVKSRISELREALGDPSVEPQVVFAQWMGLLKEINRRHGQGAMPTPLFYRLNTEILELLPLPAARPGGRELVGAGGETSPSNP